MLWLVGTGLIIVWAVLTMWAPRGWGPMLLISGITLLIIQTAAYRRTRIYREKK